MLSQVAFKNFKALEDVELDLERLTVLVGANATGKTTVLEGLQLLCDIAGKYQPEIADFRVPETLLWGRLQRHNLSTGRQGGTVIFRARRMRWIQIEIGETGSEDQVIFRDDPCPPSVYFPTAVRTSFEVDRLSAPSFATDQSPHIAPDGSGLASVIAELLVDRSPTLEAIQDDLRRMFPPARRLRAPRATITRRENEILTINGREVLNPVDRTYAGHRLELELEGSGFIPCEMLSEGTLLMLGLLTLLHTTMGERIFLIDDLDRALHPRAQAVVVTALRRFVDDHPDVQLVCTSHSPFALDHFKPEEVRVMKANSQGRVRCRKLTEHPDWNYWKDLMKPGEFWSSVGEDWVYGEDERAG